MATQVTLTYRIPRTNSSMVNLLAAVQAVPLPVNDFTPFGVSLLTDNSVILFQNVIRTLVFSLGPIFTSFALDITPPTSS